MENPVKGTQPPAPRMRGILLRVMTSEATQFICLSECAYGQMVHWWGNRSHECKHETGQCDGCKRGWPTRWKGYLHVETGSHGPDTFLEITRDCWQLLQSQSHEGQNWRGMIFKARRTKGGAKGRYLVEVLERRVAHDDLPQEKDPRELLRFLWSCKRASSVQ